MQERLEQRLGELRSERQAGEKMLAKLEADRAGLQQTLLRISGAIQVLEELLEAGSDTDQSAAPPKDDGLVDATT